MVKVYEEGPLSPISTCTAQSKIESGEHVIRLSGGHDMYIFNFSGTLVAELRLVA